MSEETLFHEALAKPAGERVAFLDVACVGQPQLRAAVLALLAAHEGSGSLLDRPPVESGPAADAAPAAPRPAATTDFRPQAAPGLVIAGRYTLVEKIGEGGMGEVWVAKQTEPVKRKVALKLIKAGMDSRAVLQRFEQERQALALMDHPNIARVLDGGLTPEGHPFFVMELVNGLPLTRFCDEARLTPRQRLELFAPICQAVQHAHQKGIIHRDLKPANILVTLIDGKPIPKVIDFGVAKATAGKLTDESLSTQFGAVVGTLEYMAPEQAGYSGADIDTRSDIYSLGVILYELLTGLRPLDAKRLRQAALSEAVRILREEEPSKPSTRLSTEESLPSLAALRQTEPKKLMALLRGELDWVVMKCLEKQRDRRYETANGLARDVQRYLADEPVEARPPTAGYRLRKFLRRNKGPVLAAGLVLLALLGGIIGTTFGMVHAEQRRLEAEEARGREAEQRAKAEKARDRTRQALDAMTSSVTGDSLTTQKEISAEQKKFLTEVLSYYQEFAGETADDEQSRFRTAEAADRVGMIELRLGRKAEAAAAYDLARDGFEKLAADFPAVPLYRLNLAIGHNNLGLLLNDLGKGSEAKQQYRQALALLEKLAADFPAVPEYRQTLAESHYNLGILLRDMGKWAEAEQQYRQALALQEKLAADFPAVPLYRLELANSRSNRGALLHDLGEGAEAEQQYRQALALQEKLAADFPAVPLYRHGLANGHHNLGILLADVGKHQEAEREYRQVLALQEKLAADFPAVPRYRQELANSHNGLGNLLRDLGEGAEAEQQHRQALALQEKLAADFPAVPEYRQELAGSHTNLGVLLAGLGKRAEAEQQYRQARVLQEQLAADFPAMPRYRKALAASHNNLGRVLAGQGKVPEAEQQYRQALALYEKLTADFPTVPQYRHELAISHHNLGVLLKDLGKRAEAEQQYRQALALYEKLNADFPAMPQYQTHLGGAYCDFGLLIAAGGEPGKSLEWYANAIRTLTTIYDQDRRSVVPRQYLRNSHWDRAIAYDRLHRYAEAVKDWDRAVELSPEQEQPGFRVSRATARVNAGQVADAVADVAALTKMGTWNAWEWYNFACVYALASGKSADQKQPYADRAVDLLQRAVKAGYTDAAHMRKDTDLDSLRARDDFKNLIGALEKKSAARPEKQP
jgi:serine/threonine protein kinase/Flp pilus assembly protein TadD